MIEKRISIRSNEKGTGQNLAIIRVESESGAVPSLRVLPGHPSGQQKHIFLYKNNNFFQVT